MIKRSGFTLVELLVVISIIGILAMITSSTFITAQTKGRDIKRKAELASLVRALQMYYNDFGKFPDPSLVNLNTGGSLAANNYVYMAVLPVEQKLSDKPYIYMVSPGFKSYNLFADLENRDDKECLDPPWTVGGVNYCYGVSSPNASVGKLTNP